MAQIFRLHHPIRAYPWGSRTFIPELLGRTADGGPQAEMWMGAHPTCPSEVEVGDRRIPLNELVKERREEILGAPEGDFPFLFKVLAAAQPLSIQAHPDAGRAAAGFRREEAAGIPLDAPHRSYRDPHPKPELIYTLTPFRLLSGFRPAVRVADLLREAGLGHWQGCNDLQDGDEPWALARSFERLLNLPPADAERLVRRAIERAGRPGASADLAAVGELAAHWGADRGVLGPLFLNLRHLPPGTAVFTPPGILHAYLEGAGLELMVSSDNVLRGGLTTKHIDVRELLKVASFRPRDPQPQAPLQHSGGGQSYDLEGTRLRFSLLQIGGEGRLRLRDGGVGILLCLEGGGEAVAPGGERLPLRRGQSLLVPANVSAYDLLGNGTFCTATSYVRNQNLL